MTKAVVQNLTAAPDALVTSVRIERNGGPHAYLTVWVRGGNAGVLTVDEKDAEMLARRILVVPDAGGVHR